MIAKVITVHGKCTVIIKLGKIMRYILAAFFVFLLSVRILSLFDTVQILKIWFYLLFTMVIVIFFCVWKFYSFVKSTFLILFLLSLSFFYIKYPLLNGYSVDDKDDGRFTSSNFPTIRPGDVIISKHFGISLQPGNMVVFKINGNFLRKRLHGKPGDQVHICNSDVYINGLSYSYKNGWVGQRKENNSICSSRDSYFNLSEDEYFVLGDNKKDSYDSRHFGTVKESQFIANSLYVIRYKDTNEIIYLKKSFKSVE